MEQTVELRRRWPGTGAIRALNTRLHAPALQAFAVVVLSHWLEHLVQAVQIWVLDMPRHEAGGLLGYVFPVLVTEEWLHYGYAAAMLAGLVLLMPGFTGRARSWWATALALQVWHHFEHLLLFFQAQAGTALFGREVPTSVLQLAFQRAELHLWSTPPSSCPWWWRCTSTCARRRASGAPPPRARWRAAVPVPELAAGR